MMMTIDDVQWQSMPSYPAGADSVLLRDAGGRVILGMTKDGETLQQVDVQMLPVAFEPVQWAECPDELVEAYAFG